MTVYALVEFLHVLAAMGIFAAAALEWSTLGRLRRAESIEQARAAAAGTRASRAIGGLSMGVVFIAGMYLSGTAWGIRTPWVAVALASFILLGAIGGVVTGRRMTILGKQLAASHDALSPELRARLRDPFLIASFRIRIALLAGIVFQMVAKPQWTIALTSAGASIALGILASIPAWRAASTAVAAPGVLERPPPQTQPYTSTAARTGRHTS